MTTYNLLKDNNQFFIRFENNIPYVYIADASGNLTCWSGVSYCSDWGGFLNNTAYIESLNPSACSGDKIFTKDEFEGEQVYYRVPWQVVQPLDSEIANLCNTYRYNFSKKIKITIHDDPIFSGVYVFDWDNGGTRPKISNNIRHIPGDWKLNLNESSISLNQHPGDSPVYSGEYLVSLDILRDSDNTDIYHGYFENKLRRNGPSDVEALDTYAFPCNIIFTAIQPTLENIPSNNPPGPPSYCGSYYSSNPTPTGVGHRAVVCFKTPIRYNRPYGDWIVVDRIPMTISGIAPNYATINQTNGTNGNATSYDIDFQTNNPIAGTGLLNIYKTNVSYSINSSPVCTGISYSGTAFKVSATGMGRVGNAYGGQEGVTENFNNTFAGYGLGRSNTFMDDSWQFVSGINCTISYPTFSGTRWFEPKMPLKATIEFVNSCRNNFMPCSGDLIPVPSISYYYASNCIEFWGSYIDMDYYCDTQKFYVNDTQIGTINNIEVIYSGYYDSNQQQAYYIGLAGYKSGIFTGTNNEIDLYQPINITGSQVINIPYTGTKTVSELRDWIYNSVGVYLISMPGNASGIPQTKHSVLDLFLSTSGSVPSRTLTAKLFRQDYRNDLETIEVKVYNGEVSGVNGYYQYSTVGNGGDITPQFAKAFNLDRTIPVGGDLFWSIRQLSCEDPTSKSLTASYWVIGSGTESNFTKYYQYYDASNKPWSPPFFTPNTVTIFSGVNISYGSGAVVIENRNYYV